LALQLHQGSGVEQMLEAEELAAIRAAMGQAAQAPASTPASADGPDGTPVALIAEDRAAVQARPNGIKLANRWARAAKRQLARMTGAKVDIDVLGAESVDVASLRDELTLAWGGGVIAAGRTGALVVGISGPMIESLAARMLGAPHEEGPPSERAPSSVAMRLFRPAGEIILRALTEAWQEEQSCEAALLDDAQALRARNDVLGTGVVLSVSLAVRGATSGQIRLVGRPETLIAPAARVDAVAGANALIQQVLGDVPVEVSVELGRAAMTMGAFGALRPGAVITLDRFVDDLLPVRVQGVVKAAGRAMVARNAMAVEIADPRKAKESEAA
jgi:flagellar motor switch protein FliM